MSFYDSIKIIINITLIIIFGVIIKWFINERKISHLNKRLSKYTIESKKNVEFSLFDQILNIYDKVQNSLLNIFSKSTFLVKYSHKYDKYTNTRKSIKANSMNYIVAKFLCSLLFLVLVIVSDILQKNGINILSIMTALLMGFFVPDIFLISKRAVLKKSMENDLLQAITIMNNSFKAGRSIMQTIKIVSEEIDGPLKEEFVQMVADLNYGLTIENVFERLEERVKLEEIKYISTSLTILNKTGGNIVKVFSSIEKTFFNNRKLDEELKNLTAASKFLYRVLMLVPVIFILIIYLLDPSYFVPLFTSTLGYIITIVIIIIYVTYLFTVKRVMKIKE